MCGLKPSFETVGIVVAVDACTVGYMHRAGKLNGSPFKLAVYFTTPKTVDIFGNMLPEICVHHPQALKVYVCIRNLKLHP